METCPLTPLESPLELPVQNLTRTTRTNPYRPVQVVRGLRPTFNPYRITPEGGVRSTGLKRQETEAVRPKKQNLYLYGFGRSRK